MNGKVRCITGDIATEKLGFTQCHEHIFLERGRPCFSKGNCLWGQLDG